MARPSCYRVICGALLQIWSLPTTCPPRRGALGMCGTARISGPPRAQYMYEKRFHDAKSWPFCCISPAPAPSTIALLHRKWLKRSHKVLNFSNSRNLKSQSHIFEFPYITQLSYGRKVHQSRASAIKLSWPQRRFGLGPDTGDDLVMPARPYESCK